MIYEPETPSLTARIFSTHEIFGISACISFVSSVCKTRRTRTVEKYCTVRESRGRVHCRAQLGTRRSPALQWVVPTTMAQHQCSGTTLLAQHCCAHVRAVGSPTAHSSTRLITRKMAVTAGIMASLQRSWSTNGNRGSRCPSIGDKTLPTMRRRATRTWSLCEAATRSTLTERVETYVVQP